MSVVVTAARWELHLLYKVVESEEPKDFQIVALRILLGRSNQSYGELNMQEKIRSFQTEHSGKTPHKTQRMGSIIQ